MTHVRKLQLTGTICGRDKKVSSYYSWPKGCRQNEVEDIIHGFRKAFCNVTVVIQHHHLD